MKRVTIPKVVFRGRLTDHEGHPITDVCWLRPRNPVGCFVLDELLVSTTSVAIVPAADGTFAVNVLPTDVGVDSPWFYELFTPAAAYRLSIPARSPVNDLQAMLAAGAQ